MFTGDLGRVFGEAGQEVGDLVITVLRWLELAIADGAIPVPPVLLTGYSE